MDFEKLRETLEPFKQKNILIALVGSPDPDSIASSLALQALLEKYEINSKVYHTQPISLNNNNRMINELDIPVNKIESFSDVADEYEGYAVLDYSKTSIGLDLPCVIHIDHHKSEKNNPAPLFQCIETDVGAAATIMAEWVEEEKLFDNYTQDEQLSTALSFAIYNDTDKLTVKYKRDLKALTYLQDYVDNKTFQSVAREYFSASMFSLLVKGFSSPENITKIESWYIMGVSLTKNRDDLAKIADLLICREGVSTAFVYGIVEGEDTDTVEGCVRTFDMSFDFNAFLKKISPNSGNKKHKGAFSIDLGMLSKAPDKEKLWELVKSTILGTVHELLEPSAVKDSD